MLRLHHNPDEWKEPDKFIPERFDPSSPYYLTPHGKKRHPMSFGPFLGGKRICIGKTFAEMSSKMSIPMILSRFQFEFVDKTLYDGKLPSNNVELPH
jgi:steroid 17alpha-monooxygenase/17alpha-hydroxyprogesterone aldolase